MKKGLILEGGAMRGMFTAGVTDVMMEHGITFDGAVGVSAGAAFGCNYKSAQSGRAFRYNVKYCRDARYCSIRSLIKTGDLYGADFCYREIPEELDIFDTDTYRASPMEFYVVCTDIETGKAVYHKCESCDREDLEWMRASASMPLVSRIVEVGGYRMLDGGVSDSIPLDFFKSIGYTKNIVILTQPKGYVKGPNKVMPIAKLKLKKYPHLLEAMENRHNVYNSTLKKVWDASAREEVLVICPDEALPIKRVERDPEKLRTVYMLGREAAERRIDEIANFLK